MKKTLIALAALAVVGAASAQSTVTMYGILDLGVTSATDSLSIAGTPVAVGEYRQTGLKSLTSSRLGFKGSEDLGGGLKANFTLEYGINPDEDSSIGKVRTGLVGLSGAFGSVNLGRQYTPYYNVRNAMDFFGNINAPGYVVKLHDRERASNSVTYTSPTISGFTGAFMVASGEKQAVEGVSSATGNSFGLSAVYAAGPLVVGFGYDDINKPGTTTIGGLKTITTTADLQGSGANVMTFGGAASDSVRVWDLGASYDFGVAKASLAYSNLKDDKTGTAPDIDSSGYNISVAVPFGALTAIANLGRAKVTEERSGDATVTGYQLGVNYALSKRTAAYAVYARDNTSTDGVAGDYTRKQTSIGIRHAF